MSFHAVNTTSYTSPSLGMDANNTPWPGAEAFLEASIPGFSIISTIAKSYLRLDVSALVSALLPVAALVAAARYAYGPVWSYLWQYGSSTAEVRSDDEMYNYLMFWISQQKFAASSRKFLAGTKFRSDSYYSYSNEDDEESRDEDGADWQLADSNFDEYWAQTTARDKFKTIYFTPRDGTHYFQFKGQYLAFTRETSERGIGRYTEKKEILHISCLGRDSNLLKELLKEAQRLYVDRDRNKIVIYRKCGCCDDWQRRMARPARPLSTVVLDLGQKQALVDDIKEYLHPLTKRWYANRGIPYRRGYLLYGPPGTGKTSLCFAVAGLFRLKVYVLTLSSRSLTEDGLTSLFDNLPSRCVVLLEDVDTAGITHNRSETPASGAVQSKEDAKDEEAKVEAGGPKGVTTTPPPNNISLSGLLNIIDGVASSESRILIMTTNHPEKLDPALLRPGRVDMSIAFENASTQTAKELFKSTYISREEDYLKSSNPDADKKPRYNAPKKFQFSDQEVNDLAAEFSTQIPSGEFSPADIQNYLLSYKSTPQEAAKGAAAWTVKAREERERRQKPGGDTKRPESPEVVDKPSEEK